MMNQHIMQERTKEFAKDVIKFCRDLQESREGKLIGTQLFRSATSVAANYRAAYRARSRAEFVAKLGLVEEEADEALFWLEMLRELEINKSPASSELLRESDELVAIIVSTIKTVRKRSPK